MGIKNKLSAILDEYIDIFDAVAWIAKCEEVSTSEAAEWLLMNEADKRLQKFFISGASVSEIDNTLASKFARICLISLAENKCRTDNGPNLKKRERIVIKIDELMKFVTDNDSSIILDEEIRPHYVVNSMSFFERTALLEKAIRELSARFQCETGLIPDLSDDFPDLDINLSDGLLRDFNKGPDIGNQIIARTEDSNYEHINKSENPSDTALKMLAGLALVLADKGGKYRRGERPNQSNIAMEIESICQSVPNADTFGLNNENIRKYLSKGLALLGNT